MQLKKTVLIVRLRNIRRMKKLRSNFDLRLINIARMSTINFKAFEGELVEQRAKQTIYKLLKF